MRCDRKEKQETSEGSQSQQANSRALTADAADSYILLQMEVYDQFMGNLLDRWKTDKAFERYNGSGPAARKYAARAMAHLATLTPPPGPA